MILLPLCLFIPPCSLLPIKSVWKGDGFPFLFPKALLSCYLIPTTIHHFCLWHHDQLLWKHMSKGLGCFKVFVETSLKKTINSLNSVHLLGKKDLRGRGRKTQLRCQEVPNCMFIRVLTEYGYREGCRLVSREADIFCLSTGRLTALKVPLQVSTIILPERPSSLKTALFCQGSPSLRRDNRKPEIRPHTQLRLGRRAHSHLTKQIHKVEFRLALLHKGGSLG